MDSSLFQNGTYFCETFEFWPTVNLGGAMWYGQKRLLRHERYLSQMLLFEEVTATGGATVVNVERVLFLLSED